MENTTDEEGNAFQWRVRLSLHLFKLLSVSAWLAVTRLTVNSQEQRGSMRWSQIKKCCYYTAGGWEENALVQQSTEKRQMRKFFFFLHYFFSKVLLEKMECSGGKWMLCFLSLIQAELSTLTECVPSRRVKNSLYLHFGSLPGRAHSH